MVIDGNDARGIDVGILSTERYPIENMRSHVDDGPIDARIFSRDCPEYSFSFPKSSALAGKRLVLLVNHLKSKFGGNDQASIAARTAQATRVAEIYQGLRNSGVEHVVVLGDFNDTPDSPPLQPLLADTDLKDFIKVKPFDFGAPDDRIGTFGNGTASQKIDYLLMSPKLFKRAIGAGIFRMGVWGGKNGTLFPHFPEVRDATEAGSDHAAVYVDINIG
jgi:endonuclease/exonuclease/phosphatase family metal-dependent hydrolase